jgi:hypothetical protein
MMTTEQKRPEDIYGAGYDRELRNQLSHDFGPVLLADGFDDCIIGTCYTPGPGTRVVYDTDLIIQALVDRDGLTYEEAEDHFSYNIEGGYHGEQTPIFLRRLPDETPHRPTPFSASTVGFTIHFRGYSNKHILVRGHDWACPMFELEPADDERCAFCDQSWASEAWRSDCPKQQQD